MMKIAFKALILSMVCVATWAVTSSLMEQRQAKAMPAPDRPSRNPEALSEKSVKATGHPSPQAMLGTSGALAEVHLRSHAIEVADGWATASAHVSIADKRPGMSYIWRFRVVDSGNAPLSGFVYDQQMFSVEANGEKEVDFKDVIAVPPGSRRVELVLYRKAPSEDLSFLDNDDAARARQVIRAVKLLTN
jgi:hypothetical protein